MILSYDDSMKEQVIDHILQIQNKEFSVPITIGDQPDLQDIDNFYFRGNGHFWICMLDGILVGTIALLDIDHGRGVIRKMFVHEHYRGSMYGIAQRLLDTLIEHARSHAIHQLFLGTIEDFKAAHRFYEKNGFNIIEVENLPTTFPRMGVDTIFYTLNL